MSGKAPEEAPKDSAKALVADLFEHQEFSRRFVEYLENLQGGKVVSLRAPWGRGKSDVLSRAYQIALSRKGQEDSPIAAVLWINPWQYGRTNLLIPLVEALLPLVPKKKMEADYEKIKEILISLMSTTTGAILKASGMEAVSGVVAELLKGLSDANAKRTYEPDPVAPVGKAFKELIETYIAGRNQKKSQVLIFVDDLDRCLPGRQIALLEAFHFLVDAGANATFVMAIDGEILAAAARTHYRSEAFDVNRYLDKIFDLNIELPTLSPDRMKNFVAMVTQDARDIAKKRSCSLPSDFSEALLRVLKFHWKFRNARNLTRFVTKLNTYLGSGAEMPDGPTDLTLFWLMLIQTWPEARFQLAGIIDRGPKIRSGSDEEMAYRSFIEHLKVATVEPFTLIPDDQPLHLGQGYSPKNVVVAYQRVADALVARSM